jgi:hypothetical protein
MTKSADDKLGHAKREIKALKMQLDGLRTQVEEHEEDMALFMSVAILVCKQESDEWDSDRVQTNKDYAEVCGHRIAKLSSVNAAAWLLRQKAEALGEAREHMLRDAGRGRGMDVDEANAWLKVKVQHLKDAADKEGGL